MTGESISFRAALQNPASQVERFDRELLLASLLDRDRSWIWSHLDDPMDPSLAEDFAELLERRQAGEPVAYILGYREFFGRTFEVSPAVLIPRPETEGLVELALEQLPAGELCAVDVGTGSGAIALTLAAERPCWQVIGADISRDALAVAAANRDRLALTSVEFLRSDLLEALDDVSFDLIISNPPYVADDDPHLAIGDLRFEPSIALSCSRGGLALIARLIDQAPLRLRHGGWLMLEHGYDQAEAVRGLLADRGFESIESRSDLAGIERISAGRWHG